MAGSNTKEFLDKLSKKNFNKLDYSKVIYVRSKIKVIVICKEHGEFKITPSHLLEGQGCRKCGIIYPQKRSIQYIVGFLLIF